LLPVGLAFMLISRWMPQRTTLGVEEAARWRAFRRYLENLKEYGHLSEAQQILDDYFAYALALDVEEVVLTQAEEMGGAMPVWTYPAHLEPILPPTGTPATRDPATGRASTQKQKRPSSEPPQPLRMVRQQGSRQQAAKGTGEALGDAASQLSLSGLARQWGETLNQASRGIGRTLNAAVGGAQGDTPFILVLKGAGEVAETSWDVGTSTLEIVGAILETASSGEGSGGYRGSSGRSSSSTRWSSSSSRSSSRSYSGRSSSSRRSGGGGRRGFG
jgi:hypothetical protein